MSTVCSKCVHSLQCDKRKVMAVNLFIWHEWKDETVDWKPEDYDGIKMIHVRYMKREETWKCPTGTRQYGVDTRLVRMEFHAAGIAFDDAITYTCHLHGSFSPINLLEGNAIAAQRQRNVCRLA